MNYIIYRKYRKSKSLINEVFVDPIRAFVIHYSCENFSRITSIAIRNIDSGQTNYFSIHSTAKSNDIGLDNIEDFYDNFEKEMLVGFFEFVDRHRNYQWIHWNMRNAQYGFEALENRLRNFKGVPIKIDDNNKIDLSKIACDIYGSNYIEDPKLERLICKNNITSIAFLTGKQDSEAFANKNYDALKRSILRKVDAISDIAYCIHDNSLITNSKSPSIFIKFIYSIIYFIMENKFSGLIADRFIVLLRIIRHLVCF